MADAALLDPGLKKAQALLDWLRGRGAKATLREICNSGPSPLRKKAAADAAIKILEDHRCVSVEKGRSTTIILSEGIQMRKRLPLATLATAATDEIEPIVSVAKSQVSQTTIRQNQPKQAGSVARVARVAGVASDRPALLFRDKNP